MTEKKSTEIINIDKNNVGNENENFKFIPEATYENFSPDNYSTADSNLNRNFVNNMARKEFCRSAFFLLAIQIVIAASVAYLNFFIHKFLPKTVSLCLVYLHGFWFFGLNVSLWFCFECRLYFPMNIIVLFIYTVSEGCIFGSFAFAIQVKAVS